MDGTTAQSLYREEKARALQERRISHAQLMAEAKEAFAKMLADAQLARKGGRPKSNPGAPNAAAKPAVVQAKPTAPAPAKKAVVAKPAAPVKAEKVEKAKPAKAGKPVVKKVAAAKAPSTKLRVAAKRGTALAAKATAKKPAKKVASARASRPAARTKSAKKR